MSKKSIVKGALILTLANIITKLLGFIYRIYMSNTIGAEGMGLFQLIMPLYMLVWSISSSGFSTTISKLVSEENIKRNYKNTRLILKQCLITSTLIAIILSIVFFTLSNYISNNIFKDYRTSLALDIMTISFPFMAAGSCIRGYFFGLQNSTIPAISQILEQVSRMVVVYLLSSIFIPLGLTYAAGVAVIGMCIGEIFSFLYVFLEYKSKSKNFNTNKENNINKTKLYFKILKMSIPLTANRVIGSFLSTIENILIPQKLKIYGYSEKEAISIFGQLSGMAMPLIMFPSSLLISLSISLIPAISEAIAVKNTKIIEKTISKTFLFTLIIGIGTCGLFIAFPFELGLAIYNQKEIGNQLFLLSFICPFIYIQVTLSGILNGLGEQFFIFKNSLISSIINILFISFIMPIYGIKGLILGYLISYIITTYLGFKKVYQKIKFKLEFKNSIFIPILCISSSCIISKLIYKNISNIFEYNISLFISISFLVIFYIALLIILDCIKIKDIKFPNIHKRKRI